MIIDIECDIPTKEVYQAQLNNFLNDESSFGYLLKGYLSVYGKRWASAKGINEKEYADAIKMGGYSLLWKLILEKSIENAMSEEEFITVLDKSAVTYACIGTGNFASIEHTAYLARKYDNRFIPWVKLNPHDGIEAVNKLTHCFNELGFKGLAISPFRDNIYANNKKYYPLYAKCVELNIPIRVHTSMSYASDRAMDFGRPIYLDEVATDFPELTIIAGLGGWPWVPELVGLARRHLNVYVDIASHRPKYIGKPGSGFEVLLHFGNTVLQDRILFASGWQTLSLPLAQVIEEMSYLAKNEVVRNKWMFENASRILNLSL